MTEEKKKLPTNALTAEELLQNKGLKYKAWNEYERSAETLPKIGMKQFEPDNSWLQNMQIEKGIKSHKNLIAVERVDRISQLASAEWLPLQKRARVKKFTGVDWGNFGLEKNCVLYLLPEEALFLLETNCLELTWNDVPLSIQQAYELLIDNVECTIEEYRVYSHLVRYGYRIQRFIYDLDKNIKNDESSNTKRKVIVEPENGLWKQSSTCTNIENRNSVSDQQNIHIDTNNSIEIHQEVTELQDIPDDVHKVVNDLVSRVENIEIVKNEMEDCALLDTDVQTENTNHDKKKRNSKVEIISEETLLGNIKIVTDSKNNCTKGNTSAADWRSARIQRNVKLLPKRIDKALLPTPDVSVLDSSTTRFEHISRKHKASSPVREELQNKRSKQEVIELSDDEIEEVPKPKSRMDLLNLIPNTASKPIVTVKISRGYIPHSIKPYKNVYHYENGKLKNSQEIDNRTTESDGNGENLNNNTNRNTIGYNNASMSHNIRSTHVATLNHNLGTNIQNVFMQQNYYSMEGRQYANFNSNYMYGNRMPFPYSQNSFWHQRNTIFQNVFVALGNHGAAFQNRFMSVQMNNFSIPNTSNNMTRSFLTRNQLYDNFQQNFMPLRKLYDHKIIENMSYHCSVARTVSQPEPRQRYWPRHSSFNHYKHSNVPNRNNEFSQSAFKVLSGASSWSELKAKWRDEKTITIDDEDTRKDEECDEIQVVGRLRSPLIGSKSVNTLEEVFSKLKIIKTAPEKTVRRKKNRHRISYNVYSNIQNYRKANPGPPLYRIVVIKQDDPFLQPIELHRLVQDANHSQIIIACVSMTISYIQPGFVSIPNNLT
ncbi:PREDICTED: putative uncharacterized protein DDB_G0282133 [Dufourea novaeangliae]|uniref:tRNA-splicing endonuclease subunit Sen54 n=1 Tax=Dufourea novaeangliae TaxID=178035 RepID=A0A154PG08_DUFNO|nr:PREDICTED: putative uncharacterized protein DDB_G0282133 [Dufourea novaeangliae]KZC10248.1 tRNA-splicing endonuclease subunit Sen54 [Dufourea novaeangliae]